MAGQEPLALRLALVFADAARRPALAALYAIDAELAAATRPGIEHGVAHAKLGWWRAEADRLAAGRPEHPLSRALLAAAGPVPDYRLLHERLSAADLALAGFEPATLAELEALRYRSHGALEQLGAEVLAGRRDARLAEYGAALGRGLGLAAPGRTAGGVDPALVAARAATELERAATLLPPPLRAAQAPGLVRAALARAALAGAARSPLMQLWLAWRTAARARQE